MEVRPEMGSHCRSMPKKSMSSRANQKEGMAKPRKTRTVTVRSSRELRAAGRNNAHGNGDGQGKEQRNQVHAHGKGQTLQNSGQHGPAIGGHGIAEIQVQQAHQPVPVLHVQRAVQPVEGLQPLTCSPRRQGLRVVSISRGRTGGQVMTQKLMMVMPQSTSNIQRVLRRVLRAHIAPGGTAAGPGEEGRALMDLDYSVRVIHWRMSVTSLSQSGERRRRRKRA